LVLVAEEGPGLAAVIGAEHAAAVRVRRRGIAPAAPAAGIRVAAASAGPRFLRAAVGVGAAAGAGAGAGLDLREDRVRLGRENRDRDAAIDAVARLRPAGAERRHLWPHRDLDF